MIAAGTFLIAYGGVHLNGRNEGEVRGVNLEELMTAAPESESGNNSNNGNGNVLTGGGRGRAPPPSPAPLLGRRLRSVAGSAPPTPRRQFDPWGALLTAN